MGGNESSDCHLVLRSFICDNEHFELLWLKEIFVYRYLWSDRSKTKASFQHGRTTKGRGGGGEDVCVEEVERRVDVELGRRVRHLRHLQGPSYGCLPTMSVGNKGIPVHNGIKNQRLMPGAARTVWWCGE